jgi:hypothetical protein
VTITEFFVFVMLFIACSWYIGGDRRELFLENRPRDILGIRPVPHFERFLPRAIFEKIYGIFAFKIEGNDLWAPIRPMIAAFDNCFKSAVRVGPVLTVDESFVPAIIAETPSYLYNKGIIIPDTNAPRQKNKEKPKGDGYELKTVAVNTDANAPLLVRMEPVGDRGTEFTQEYPAIVAAVLRLLEPYFGTWRLIILDSAFGSVELAIALLDKQLFTCAVVKTNTHAFPKKWLHNEAKKLNKGHWVTLVSDVTLSSVTYEIAALCWRFRSKHKKSIFTMISTGLATTAGTPVPKRRFVNGAWHAFTLPCPQVINVYLKHHGYVDHHNQIRQDIVRLEAAHRTSEQGKRMFAFLLGGAITNAHSMWRNQIGTINSGDSSMLDFQERLVSKYLLANTEYGQRVSSMASVSSEPSGSVSVSDSKHQLVFSAVASSSSASASSLSASSSSTSASLLLCLPSSSTTPSIATRWPSASLQTTPLPASSSSSSAKTQGSKSIEELIMDALRSGHYPVSIKSLPSYMKDDKRGRAHCKLCGNRTTHCCSGCTDIDSGEIYHICHYDLDQDGCFLQHLL